MTNYVLAFGFDGYGNVILVRKKRPEWQRGRLNSVGGKVEEGEDPAEACVREFREETTVVTVPAQWLYFGVMSGPDWSCRCYAAKGIDGQRTPFDVQPDAEHVEVWPSGKLPEAVLPNLHWLVPLAKNAAFGLDENFHHVVVIYGPIPKVEDLLDGKYPVKAEGASGQTDG